ncbi:probable cytochrome P450 12d1 proximal, mitochondrial [Drosophila ficusphila]|uniref:probable cytochrome P450 12d1 proximal, mitochondrial n=1 Tax=Drosophila ficusphila TaxID=30025 RepID=UPI0007E6E348|nr:probable cytochrome P450 12d1 proximal, mitochondrial [Drosophila ficusphila]
MNTLSNARSLAICTGPIRSMRSVSAVAQSQVNANTAEDLKSFDDIPRPKKFKFMRAFMPGGEFYNASIVDYTTALRKRYGDIFILPGMFGRPDWVTTFSTKDIETVFRNEGIWPVRDTFESLVYFRKHVRPDVYGEVQGLTSSQNEEWGKLLDFQPSMWKVVSTPTYRKMMKALNGSLDVALKLLKESQDDLEKRRQAGEKINSNSMMERLMEIDPKVAVVMGLDTLFAGVDATSTLLSAVLLCLSKHPEKQTKLREELLKIMPTKDTLLNEETMKDMPYLRAVIKEAIRYYPNSLGTMRSCQNDVVLSGYNVPKGTTVLLGSNVLMKDSTFYSRPEEFLPERWLRDPETGKKSQVSPFTFLPFGFGPRMCIGKRIVDLEIETSVAKLIRNFQVEFNRDASKPYKTMFIMEPAIPFPFKFTDIDN